MIYVDSRVGSGDLPSLLTPLGIPCTLTTIDFGDCCFLGNGPAGRPWQIGIEIKTLGDLLNCIQTKRFSGHQLPGLLRQYDAAWLIVEGLWRINHQDGVLETRHRGTWIPVVLGSQRRPFIFRDLDQFLLTVEMKAGIHVKTTNDRSHTARAIASLYHWFTAKEWAEHRSHIALSPQPFGACLSPPSLLRRIAAEMPGIGVDRSEEVERHFGSVRAMLTADEKEWRTIKGIGKKIATEIIKELNR